MSSLCSLWDVSPSTGGVAYAINQQKFYSDTFHDLCADILQSDEKYWMFKSDNNIGTCSGSQGFPDPVLQWWPLGPWTTVVIFSDNPFILLEAVMGLLCAWALWPGSRRGLNAAQVLQILRWILLQRKKTWFVSFENYLLIIITWLFFHSVMEESLAFVIS